MSHIRAISTTGGIAIDGPNEDDAYENRLAEELTANPEQLSMQDAFIAGQRAASFSHGASMNPYQNTVPEHAEWERGRMGALGLATNGPRCRYHKGRACDCGGRWTCVEAA